MEVTVLTDRLAEIEREVEKQKVQLTPEVRAYMEKHIARIQQKLSNQQLIKERDLQFLREVKCWVHLSPELRERWSSIDVMKAQSEYQESQMRGITVQQWIDLYNCISPEAFLTKDDIIASNFEFSKGYIICKKNFSVAKEIAIERLPENLHVKKDMFLFNPKKLSLLPPGLKLEGGLYASESELRFIPDDCQIGRGIHLSGSSSFESFPSHWVQINGDVSLADCPAFKGFPAKLKTISGYIHINKGSFKKLGCPLEHVGGQLVLEQCEHLEELPESLVHVGNDVRLVDCRSLKRLPKNLKQYPQDLLLKNCRSLQKIPEYVSIGRDLDLRGCRSLVELPDTLCVERNVFISQNAPQSLKNAIKRLQEKGKIKGNMKY